MNDDMEFQATLWHALMVYSVSGDDDKRELLETMEATIQNHLDSQEKGEEAA